MAKKAVAKQQPPKTFSASRKIKAAKMNGYKTFMISTTATKPKRSVAGSRQWSSISQLSTMKGNPRKEVPRLKTVKRARPQGSVKRLSKAKSSIR